jgi:hypothetical protein
MLHPKQKTKFKSIVTRSGGIYRQGRGDPATALSKAIDKSSYTWRKPSTLAEETGLALDTVVKVLSRSSHFVKADHPADDGQPLFSTYEKLKRKNASFGLRVLNAFANKVIE